MLSSESDKAANASLLVKVIQVSRGPGEGSDGFDVLLSSIVAGTNWQNAIKVSDLIANDRTQIELERELRKLGYLYIRKRQSKFEAMRHAGLPIASRSSLAQTEWMARFMSSPRPRTAAAMPSSLLQREPTA